MEFYPVTAKANGAGQASAALPQRPPGKRLRVVQVTISSDSALASTAALVLNNSFLITASAMGNQDTASGEPAIELDAKDALQVNWSNLTPNANCLAIFIYTTETTKVG